MKLFIVAGELSGDLLGARLVAALRERVPALRVMGVAGPELRAAGCETLADVTELSLMGLAEILPALPRLFRLRARLLERIADERPDVFIGVDAPDFNLGLARRVRERGIRTVQYVSPTIWAWRPGRVHTIARSVDQVLCLFPFEPAHYAGHGVRADFVGHPLADQLDDSVSPAEGRAALGLPERPTLAVLPGSRAGEIQRLMAAFAATAARLAVQLPGLQVLTPVAQPGLLPAIEAACRRHAPDVEWRRYPGQSQAVLRAADAVLLASGTATLETLLLGRPMVVGYAASPLTAWLLRRLRLLKVSHVALANLLSDPPVVPEHLQEACEPDRLTADLLPLLTDPAARERQLATFRRVRGSLAVGAAERAASAVLEGLEALDSRP